MLLGCQRHVDGTPEVTSFIDSLPLSLERVEQISGFDRFTREIDSDLPTPSSYLPDGPCRAMADQRIAFGDTWTGFRSVADSAELTGGPLSPVVSVTQNLVAYPDDAAAREVFDRHADDMAACAELNLPGLDGTVTHPDSETAVWVNDGMAIMFTIKSAIFIEASAVALPDAERIAFEISRAIIERIESGR